jgi:hypothetical protein
MYKRQDLRNMGDVGGLGRLDEDSRLDEYEAVSDFQGF